MEGKSQLLLGEFCSCILHEGLMPPMWLMAKFCKIQKQKFAKLACPCGKHSATSHFCFLLFQATIETGKTKRHSAVKVIAKLTTNFDTIFVFNDGLG